MKGKFITYFRVSTADQGKSGLGLAAQRKTVMDYLNGGNHQILDEFQEIESGGNNNRPALQKAIRDCELKGARLIVAKLDRLSRDLHFITTLQESKVKFVVAEMPDATELTIHIYAAMAQHERKVIGERTKAALERKKAEGTKLGNPHLGKNKIPTMKMVNNPAGDTTNARESRKKKADDYARKIYDVIQGFETTSLRETAKALNNAGYETARGGKWQATSVKRIFDRVKIPGTAEDIVLI